MKRSVAVILGVADDVAVGVQSTVPQQSAGSQRQATSRQAASQLPNPVTSGLKQLSTEPYAEAAAARERAGYTGDDCELCPGLAACVTEYDRRCVQRRQEHDVFPCGLRPTNIRFSIDNDDEL